MHKADPSLLHSPEDIQWCRLLVLSQLGGLMDRFKDESDKWE